MAHQLIVQCGIGTLGIYAQSDEIRNSITNPFDNNRQVYVFSDAPHLLKTVRNRLHTKKNIKSDYLTSNYS